MITFKQFLIDDAKGAQGEYKNDVAEKTMVHAIINTLMGGQKTEENYDTVYSFLEDPQTEKFYDRFYDAFAEKAKHGADSKLRPAEAKPISTEAGIRLGEFKKELKPVFDAWKARTKDESL